MKKFASVAALAAFVLLLALPAFAGEAGKEVTLTGYITDKWCGAANANAEGADCARACAKKGSEMAIYSDGQLYILSDKEMALANLGHKVRVKGTLAEDGKVQVSSIEKVEQKKA